MSKVFCPQNGSTCEDGYLEFKDDICVFYDEDIQACALAENLKYAAEQIREQARLHQPPMDTSINRMLKDINLGGGS